MQLLYKDNSSLKEVVDYLTSLKTPHLVIVEKPRRSTAQNRLFHDNVAIIADTIGYSLEEMKLIIKEWITKANKLKMVEKKETKKGLEYTVYRSSKDLDTKEFTELVEYVFQLWEALWIQMNIPALEYADELFSN